MVYFATSEPQFGQYDSAQKPATLAGAYYPPLLGACNVGGRVPPNFMGVLYKVVIHFGLKAIGLQAKYTRRFHEIQEMPETFGTYHTELQLKSLEKILIARRARSSYETCFVISFLINHKTGSAIRRCLPD